MPTQPAGRSYLTNPWLWIAVLVVVAIIVVFVWPKPFESKSRAPGMAPGPQPAGRSGRSGAQRGGAGAASSSKAGSSCRSGGGVCGSNDPFTDGATANSNLPENASMAKAVLGTALTTSIADGQGTASAKNLTLIQQGLSTGDGINLSPAEFELVKKNPQMLLKFAAQQQPEKLKQIIEASAQRLDSSGISRGKMSAVQKLDTDSTITGLDSDQIVGNVVAGKGRPQEMARLLEAVGSQNAQYILSSEQEFSNLINNTFVSTVQPQEQAILEGALSMLSDPTQKAELVLSARDLRTAVFSSPQQAREALTNYTDIAFQSVQPPRGYVGTLGSRYRNGPGGDLAPVLFEQATGEPYFIPTINKARLEACGGATTQAVAYAEGDTSVIDVGA